MGFLVRVPHTVLVVTLDKWQSLKKLNMHSLEGNCRPFSRHVDAQHLLHHILMHRT